MKSNVLKVTCSIDGCEKPIRTRGWCNMHYQRWTKHGDPLTLGQGPTPAARFWEKIRVADVADPDACWLWTAAKSNRGYGRLEVAGRVVLAHRFAYELLTGPIPAGLDLDHQCHNRDKTCRGGPTCVHRRCVNLDHLEPVPHRENVRRGCGGHLERLRTHCPAGHAYSPENTRLSQGRRHCRACNNARSAADRARKKAAA